MADRYEVAISPAQARELTDRIKVGVEAVWQLVKDAYVSRAWEALGYDSWDDYCTREFGSSRIRLPREERQEVVSSMREIGMSTRAIAAATGTSRQTVSNSLNAGVKNLTPAPITGTDGKTYPASQPRREPVEPEPVVPEQTKSVDEPIGDIITSDDLAELNQPIEKPEPHKTEPRAEAITSQFTSAIADLNRVLNKFNRITHDKNFPRNKEKVAAMHRSDLIRAIDELQSIVENTN